MQCSKCNNQLDQQEISAKEQLDFYVPANTAQPICNTCFEKMSDVVMTNGEILQ